MREHPSTMLSDNRGTIRKSHVQHRTEVLPAQDCLHPLSSQTGTAQVNSANLKMLSMLSRKCGDHRIPCNSAVLYRNACVLLVSSLIPGSA
jgi:hypothetical protein